MWRCSALIKLRVKHAQTRRRIEEAGESNFVIFARRMTALVVLEWLGSRNVRLGLELAVVSHVLQPGGEVFVDAREPVDLTRVVLHLREVVRVSRALGREHVIELSEGQVGGRQLLVVVRRLLARMRDGDVV
eukprot:173304-Pleurochrysis_carterae.AAC.5